MGISFDTEIGDGSFTKAYDQGDGTVILVSKDPVKKLISKGILPKHRMFPTIKMIDIKIPNRNVYQMEKLQILSRFTEKKLKTILNSRQFRFYEILQECSFYCGGLDSIKMRMGHVFGKEFNRELKLIFDALDSIYASGISVAFEAPTFNLAIKKDYVVLLDCFYPTRLCPVK